MNESCHIRMNESCQLNMSEHTWMSDVTCQCVTAHIWMSHVTHMKESCHTNEWVMSDIWMSHVTYMNESQHTYEWVMSHMHEWTSRVTWTCARASCVTVQHTATHCNTLQHTATRRASWFTAHTRMSHVTCKRITAHMNESMRMSDIVQPCQRAFRGVMAHIWMRLGTHIVVL